MEKVGGRYQFSFTPISKKENVRIHHDGSIADTSVTNIQIEKGLFGTSFVEPSFENTQISGLYKDIRDIKIEMIDPNSEFWSTVHMNNEAYLRTYGSNLIQSMVGQSAEGVFAQVEDLISGDYASFEMRMRGLQSTVQNNVSSTVSTQLSTMFDNRITSIEGDVSSATQLVNGFKNQLTTMDGRVSSAVQKVDGFQNTVSNLAGNYSSLAQTVDGFQTDIRDAKGNISQFTLQIDGFELTINDMDGRVSTLTRTVNGYDSRIWDAEGTVSSMSQRVNSFQQDITDVNNNNSLLTQTVNGFDKRITTAEGNVSSMSQTVSGYGTQISDVDGRVNTLTSTVSGLQSKVTGYNGLESQITQLAGQVDIKASRTDVEGIIRNSGDTIWLGIKDKISLPTGSEIVTQLSLSPSGVRISGKNIMLDGNTYITGAIIKNANIESIMADKITAGTLNAANVNVININASNIVGNTAAFVQAAFNSMGSTLSIDAYGITVNGLDGRKTMFRQGGISVFKNGVEVGAIQGNHLQGNSTATGLSFNTEPGKHMAWGRKSTSSAASYSIYMWIPNDRNVVETLVPFEPHTLKTSDAYIKNIRPIGSGTVTIVSKDNVKVADFGNTSIAFYKKLDMNNFTIVNNSDERLKNILGTTKQKAIPLLDKMEIVDYTWKDPNSPAGTHMGLIAQNTPYITEVNEKGVWGINLQKHVMFNTLTNKELLLKIRQLENEVEKLKGVV